jgi:2-polyprenyl-6-hydroxyphenyl methylase / 3-demethylubiquinone-9 3-methyltransferase
MLPEVVLGHILPDVEPWGIYGKLALSTSHGTVDLEEIRKFREQANFWWQPEGNLRALHQLNPVRLAYLRSRLTDHFGRPPGLLKPFTGLRVLDIGCGGGLIAEPLSRLGFSVTGIDAGADAIAAAREHALSGGLSIDYRVATPESIMEAGERFDVVLALEVIEHVADCNAFLECLCDLIAPRGMTIIATLNRSVRSFALAIIGAEYILGWLPRGTHDWRKFMRPSELILGLRRQGLRSINIAGLSFAPHSGTWEISRNVDVNYIVSAIK